MRRVVLAFVALGLASAVYWAYCAPHTVFTLYDREAQTVILEVAVEAGDALSLELEHSVEHFPWIEYYTVLPDNTFRLDAYAVGGYGAGVPATQSSTVRDGMVWTEDVNTVFPTLNWLTSNVYQKGLCLNDVEIFDFRTVPNASHIQGSIITKRGYFMS